MVSSESFMMIAHSFVKEIYNYAWNEKTGDVIKKDDDCMDSMRYAMYNDYLDHLEESMSVEELARLEEVYVMLKVNEFENGVGLSDNNKLFPFSVESNIHYRVNSLDDLINNSYETLTHIITTSSQIKYHA